jgi:hypothetical protein
MGALGRATPLHLVLLIIIKEMLSLFSWKKRRPRTWGIMIRLMPPEIRPLEGSS